ncbi:MAG: sensor histidine kinase, partial [Saprospiraceae bacterium]
MSLVNNQYCPDISIFRIYEDASLYAKQPEINDLYVDTDKDIATYFKIAGKNAEANSFIILTGKDTLNNLDNNATRLKELIEKNEDFLNTHSFWSIGQVQALVEANGEKTKIYRMYGKPPFIWWDYYRTPISYFTFFLFTCLLLLVLNRISKFFFGNKYSTRNIEFILYLGIFITVVHFYKFADYPLLTLFLLSTLPLSILFHRLNKRYFQYQHPVSAEFNKFVLLYSGGVILQLLAATIISLFYTKPYTSFYAHALSTFHYADQLGFLPMMSTFLIGWVLFAIGNFLNNVVKHIIQLRQKEKELIISKQKELQSQAELDALQARVNPHFLYNSLNSIAGLAQEDPAKTEEMAIALSHFFKYSTNRQTENWSTIEKEIEILETYLEIEKIRFGERLRFQ